MLKPHHITPNPLRPEEAGYVAFHAPRFAYLLQLLDLCHVNASTKILDVGPSRLTELMAERFGAAVDSLGVQIPTAPGGGRHFDFDLRDSVHNSLWPADLPRYDIIVFAEVIEHLPITPMAVLGFLRSLLKPGGLLFIQTPNAASITKRIKLLLGRNPFDMPTARGDFSSHFREYTVAELNLMAKALDFRVQKVCREYYFDARYARHGPEPEFQPRLGTTKNILYRAMPSRFREGITVQWQRVDSGFTR